MVILSTLGDAETIRSAIELGVEGFLLKTASPSEEVSKAHPVELQTLGQSVWLDDLSRALIASGELADMIARGWVSGVTSNPTIFQRAIADSTVYDAEIARLARHWLSAEKIYEALVIEDIQAVADLLRPIYERTGGGDGFVSLEVDPRLAYDASWTIAEARRLWALIDRPNVMIKVPATAPGIQAVTTLIASGINVNVTLLFAVEHYQEAANAFLLGLERRLAAGQPIGHVVSVASFFVSRVDTKVDAWLTHLPSELGGARARLLLRRAAVANARVAYRWYQALLASARFRRLAERGARPQRLLWASTSTKNPQYSDVKYVEELIGPQTVTTLPRPTLLAFLDHGHASPALRSGVEEAEAVLADLRALGLDLSRMMAELETEGMVAFEQSYEALIAAIEARRVEAPASACQPAWESVPRP